MKNNIYIPSLNYISFLFKNCVHIYQDKSLEIIIGEAFLGSSTQFVIILLEITIFKYLSKRKEKKTRIFKILLKILYFSHNYTIKSKLNSTKTSCHLK